jgi:threonine dehydratase
MSLLKGSLRLPTFEGVVDARSRIGPHLPQTPLHRYPSLDRLTGAEIVVKHENSWFT